MKLKIMSMGLTFLFFISCVSIQVRRAETIFFRKFSFDEVWRASIQAINDLGFEIRVKEEWRGFIFAEREKLPHSTLHLPPQLRVNIEKEGRWIKVDCEVVLIGKKIDYYWTRRRTVNLFFKALKKNLKK